MTAKATRITLALGTVIIAAVLVRSLVSHGDINSPAPLSAAGSDAVVPRMVAAVDAGSAARNDDVADALRPGDGGQLRDKPVSRAFRSASRNPLAGSLSGVVNANRQRALEGDGDAAYAVFDALYRCVQMEGSPSSSDAVQRNDCAQLIDDRANYLRYLLIAAQAGNVDARLAYGTVAGAAFEDAEYLVKHPREFEEYRRRTVDFLNAAATQGSADALVKLAYLHADGILVDSSPVIAYGYLWAVSQTGLFENARLGLEQMSQGMSPADVAAGIAQGERVLQTCCR